MIHCLFGHRVKFVKSDILHTSLSLGSLLAVRSDVWREVKRCKLLASFILVVQDGCHLHGHSWWSSGQVNDRPHTVFEGPYVHRVRTPALTLFEGPYVHRVRTLALTLFEGPYVHRVRTLALTLFEGPYVHRVRTLALTLFEGPYVHRVRTLALTLFEGPYVHRVRTLALTLFEGPYVHRVRTLALTLFEGPYVHRVRTLALILFEGPYVHRVRTLALILKVLMVAINCWGQSPEFCHSLCDHKAGVCEFLSLEASPPPPLRISACVKFEAKWSAFTLKNFSKEGNLCHPKICFNLSN